jgi:hypothetical protein
MTIPGKTKAKLRGKGQDMRQITSLATPICSSGQADKPAYPITPNGAYFHLYLMRCFQDPGNVDV